MLTAHNPLLPVTWPSIRNESENVDQPISINVPRQAPRGAAVKDLCAAHGLAATLRSEGAMPEDGKDIYIADTMGELGIFYRLARLCIVGGSFADIGGHNPIEPGQLDCVIFYGPVMYNFISIGEDFESRGAALRLKDEADLLEKTGLWLDHPAPFDCMAAAAQKWTDEKSHVIDDLMQDIAPHMPARARKDVAA